MSFFDGSGFTEDVGSDPWGFGVGPQADGTVLGSVTGTMAPPQDAGGGFPASYSQGVLDFFKFGVQAWQSSESQKNFLEYKRFEATNGGTFQQGRPAGVNAAAQAQAGSPLGLLLVVGAVVYMLSKG